MGLKTYTPVGLKFIFEKIKFKILYYIHHDFIRQCTGLSKDQTNMFKSLVINYFILKYRHTFYWSYKRWERNISFFTKIGEDTIQEDHIYHTKQYQTFYRKIKRDLLKAHRQISKKRCFENYCSCDQACQVSAL